MILLETRALAFGYPGRTVGAGVELSLAAGEVLCLLGPNGSGKTTLFKTLLGLLPARSGRVLLHGDDIARLARDEIARRVALVPQHATAGFPFTVAELVLMGRAPHIGPFRTPGPADHAAAAEAIGLMGIGHLAGRPCTRLSGGERQLALIARALAQGAPLLVLDEPTSSLDFGNQVRVLERIRALKAEGRAIILSTHDPAQAHALADRVALLDGGRIAALGPPETVATAAALERLYGVGVTVERLAGSGSTAVLPRY
ncbi:ABC transporter ATP-binding protein [Rhodocista pekingensis]|uniref:ABC transporter ATP-binding protein n=1 Tax=Rhodocista pekingensis TaxID=201185 RepID=A0ABW2KY83_9PROT